MSEFKTTIDAVDAERILGVCGGVESTKRLIAWMDELIGENVELMAAIVEGGEEGRENRIKHLASQISVFKRIKDASNRALDVFSGKPPGEDRTEPAGGGAL